MTTQRPNEEICVGPTSLLSNPNLYNKINWTDKNQLFKNPCAMSHPSLEQGTVGQQYSFLLIKDDPYPDIGK